MKKAVVIFICIVGFAKSTFPAPPKYTNDSVDTLPISVHITFRINQLGDTDWGKERRAVNGLVDIGEPAVGALIEALDNENWRIRSRVLEVLAQIGQPEDRIVPALIKALGDENEAVHSRAYQVLKALGQSAIAELITALDHEYPQTRAKAATLLATMRPSPADVITPALKKALMDPNIEVRRYAIYGLSRMGQPAEIFAEMSQSDVWQVRASAVRALGAVGEPKKVVLPALFHALDDFEAEVRASAASALGLLGQPPPNVIQALIDTLDDSNNEVRMSAVSALTRIGEPAMPALMQALTGDNQLVRRNIAAVLEHLQQPSPSVVSALQEALADENPLVRYRIAIALAKWGEATAVPVLIEILDRGENPHQRRSAKAVLISMAKSTRAIIPTLIGALELPIESVRLDVADALIAAGEYKPVVPVLISALQSEEETTWHRATYTLSQISGFAEEAISALVSVVLTNQQRRSEAISTLGAFGKPAVEALIQMFPAIDEDAWSYVTSALRQIGEPAIPLLISALNHESEAMRHGAATALKGMGRSAREQVLSLTVSAKAGENSALFDVADYLTSPQGLYDEARKLYLSQQYDRAKTVLKTLVETFPDALVIQSKLHDKQFQVAPAALDMLGRIYEKEFDFPAAMEAFEEMETYGETYFLGPIAEVGIYGGPSAAQAMLYQLSFLTRSRLIPDHDTAIELAHRIISEYDGVRMDCYEFCPLYEEVGAGHLIKYLELKNPPLARWEAEIRRVIDNTRNQALSADLLLILGEKSIAKGDIEYALEIVLEVINHYPGVYLMDEEAGFRAYSSESFRVYSLDAYEMFLYLYEHQPNTSDTLQQVKQQMKTHCERIQLLLTNEGHKDYAETVRKRCDTILR